MKMLINLVILLAASISFAQLTPACLGEAQIIAKVAGVRSISLSSCTVDIQFIQIFNENRICPLDLAEVVNSGVEVGLINDKDCSLKAGDDLSGTLVLNSDGKIIFQ